MRASAGSIAILAAGCASVLGACERDPGSASCEAGGAAILDAPAVDSRESAAQSADAGLDGTPADAASPDATLEASPHQVEASTSDAPADATSLSGNIGIRVANWTPDAPLFDFCLAAHGSNAFQGPMMAAAEQAQDAGLMGIASPGQTQQAGTDAGSVSAYMLLPAGQYDVRVIAFGGDCSASHGVVPDDTMLPPSPPGSLMTVALVGAGSLAGAGQGWQLHAFADDNNNKVNPADGAAPTKTALRFIHAGAGAGAVDFGLISGGNFQPLVSGVNFAEAGTNPPAGGTAPDSQGYLSHSPFVMATVAAQPSGAAPDSGALASTSSFSAAAGAVVTFALVGTGAKQIFVQCLDNAGTPAMNFYSNCFVPAP